MRAFTYDAESTDLSAAECEAFAKFVGYECRSGMQAGVSTFLSYVKVRQGAAVCDVIASSAAAIWRVPVPAE